MSQRSRHTLALALAAVTTWARAWTALVAIAGASCAASDQVGNPNQLCKPGVLGCTGSTVTMCDPFDGPKPVTTCSSGKICAEAIGCADCNPGQKACIGNEAHTCKADGTVDATDFTICPFGQRCTPTGCVDSCQLAASEVVYLMDSSNNLLAFYPRKEKGISTVLNDVIQVIGRVSCPTVTGALVNSMSIDRGANAFVNYDSGEIFQVSTASGACMRTSYTPSTMPGWQLLGLGFVTETSGGSTEKLYVASRNTPPELGIVDVYTNQLTRIAAMPGVSTPEMTGTGNAELYAYFPSEMVNKNLIARINRTSGQLEQQWILDPLPSAPSAWAFAHWGGRFYQFVTINVNGNDESRVYRYDPLARTNTLILTKSPYTVVGAGVSTCAPRTIG